MAIGVSTHQLLPSICSPGKIHRPVVRIPYFNPTYSIFSSSAVDHLRFSKSTLLSSRNEKFRICASSTSSGFSEDVGSALGEVGIFRSSGESVMFKELWDQEEGVAVVALMRHFGCVCCWELASSLMEAKPRFDAAGVKLIAVGVGPPSKAQILAERLPFPMNSLYADPERKAYNLLNLYNGVGRTFFNPASAKVFSRADSFKTALKHYTIQATPDDISNVLQQGGMFVFKGKQMVYGRMDEGTGDHAPIDDIIDACRKIPVT